MDDRLTTRSATAAEHMTITRAAPGDEHLIAALLNDRQWRQQTGSDQWRQPFPTEWIGGAIARAEFWLAWELGQPVGVVRLVEADPLFWGAADDGSALYIHTLAIRRGQADRHQLIIEWAAAEALARGRLRLRLDSAAADTALCTYYGRTGFVPRGPSMVGGEAMMLFERAVLA